MKSVDGRVREDTANGSTVNIQYSGGNRLKITLKQKDTRIWEGDAKMDGPSFGKLFSKYVNEQEYRYMNIYIGIEHENGIDYDYIATMPTNQNNLHYLKPMGNNLTAQYIYGMEIYRRKRN